MSFISNSWGVIGRLVKGDTLANGVTDVQPHVLHQEIDYTIR